jgi:hypothetical protein
MKVKVPVATLVAMFVAVVVFLTHAYVRSQAIPKPIYRPFSSFGGSWATPPLAAANYWITVEYLANEPDRLQKPLVVTVTDQATGKAVTADWRPWAGTYRGWESVVVGGFHAEEGHRYEITADREHVEKLAKWHHRLAIELTAAERNNRARNALFAW